MADKVNLLGLEDRLAADAAGRERDAVIARLAEVRTAAKLNLDKGLRPTDAARWIALLAALDAAEHTVRSVWAYLHRPGR